MVRHADRKRITNCNTEDEAGVMSDHLAIKATVRIAHFIPKKKQPKEKKPENPGSLPTKNRRDRPRRINWSDLKMKEPRDKFNAELARILEESPECGEDYSKLASAIHSAATSTIETETRKRPAWFDTDPVPKHDILERIKERNIALRNYMKSKRDQRSKQTLREARQKLRTAKENAKQSWLSKKLDELGTMDSDPKNAWRAIKELAAGLYGHHQQATLMKMRKSEGNLATNDTENAQVFAEHFGDLYNRTEATSYDPTVLEELDPIPEDANLGTPPSAAEIRKALAKMQYDKAPGPNEIPTEAFKNLTGEGFTALQNLILKFWNDPEFLPKEWTQIKLKVLPKTGDLTNPNKWRGIAVGDIAAKTTASILARRLTIHLNTFGIDEQCGCLLGKGSTDATFSLKTALQTMKEHNLSAYVLFVDLVKAFDSANRELLWKVLAIYGIPSRTIDVIKKLHQNVTYQIKVGAKISKIAGTVGVKQGDNLGPILFIILINAVAQSLNKKWTFAKPDFRWHGMNEDGTIDRRSNPKLSKGTSSRTAGKKFSITNSYYVDDAAFILQTRAELIAASKLIVSHFRRFGLTVHCGDKRNNDASKTEVMFIPAAGHETRPEDTADVMLNEHEFFGFCDAFKYLGTIFTSSLEDSTDVNKRIQKATGAFAAMAKLLKDPKLPHKLRLRAYEATVLNILLFGCESWALKQCDRRKLEACHHRFLRWMLNLNIYDVKEFHIQNEQIREELGSYTLVQHMELRRSRWLEKIANMPETRNPRKITVAWMPNPRTLGKPRQTVRHSYAHTLNEGLNLDDALQKWIPIARNHQEWASRVESSLGLASGSYKPFKIR